jgi:hypothetical protein
VLLLCFAVALIYRTRAVTGGVDITHRLQSRVGRGEWGVTEGRETETAFLLLLLIYIRYHHVSHVVKWPAPPTAASSEASSPRFVGSFEERGEDAATLSYTILHADGPLSIFSYHRCVACMRLIPSPSKPMCTRFYVPRPPHALQCCLAVRCPTPMCRSCPIVRCAHVAGTRYTPCDVHRPCVAAIRRRLRGRGLGWGSAPPSPRRCECRSSSTVELCMPSTPVYQRH